MVTVKQKHTINPFYNYDSEILILGTMPSKKSREAGFYYMHPQNKFWKILSVVYGENIGPSINERKSFLLKNKIALWDVCSSCEIVGSSDSSIKNIEINDVRKIIDNSRIKHIYTTGKKAYQLYNKYLLPKVEIEAICLFSPSPANCAIKFDQMVNCYQIIKDKKE